MCPSVRKRDKVHIFYPIRLKVTPIVCFIVRINPIENEEIHQTFWENGAFKILVILFTR